LSNESNSKYIFAAREKNTAREDADVDCYFLLAHLVLELLAEVGEESRNLLQFKRRRVLLHLCVRV